jgi:hypothetical protein
MDSTRSCSANADPAESPNGKKQHRKLPAYKGLQTFEYRDAPPRPAHDLHGF